MSGRVSNIVGGKAKGFGGRGEALLKLEDYSLGSDQCSCIQLEKRKT